MFIFTAFVFRRSALCCCVAIVRMEENRTILMLCCLHFPTVKKQPIISWQYCCDISGDLAACDSAQEIFSSLIQFFFPFFFLLLLSPSMLHPHAHDWLNGHPCFCFFQKWATKMLTHVKLDPVSKLWIDLFNGVL